MPETHKPEERLERIDLPSLISQELGTSRSEARRLINAGAVTATPGGAVLDYEPLRQYLAGKTVKVGSRRSFQVPGKPPTHTPVGASDEGEWPVIDVARERPGNRPLIDSAYRRTGCMPPRWKRIEVETYYPASHPAVLGPAEVQLVVNNLHMPVRRGAPEEAKAVRELWDRLSSYAQKEEG